MAKNRNEGNVNDPGQVIEERPYYDDKTEKAEQEKLPVEYLAFLEKKKENRALGFIIWSLVLFIVLVIAPGRVGKEYDARTGEFRYVRKFFWGQTEYKGQPRDTEWSIWYYQHDPTPVQQRWIPYEIDSPAIFGVIAIPIMEINYGWEMPENLIQRMRALEVELGGGREMDIARTLHAVNNGEEWNAIIVPLSMGEAREAKYWWLDHKDLLMGWAEMEPGTPLSQAYIDEANAYIASFYEPDGNEIPLF